MKRRRGSKEEEKDGVLLSAEKPQRTEKAPASFNFSNSNLPRMWIFFPGLGLSAGLMTRAVVKERG